MGQLPDIDERYHAVQTFGLPGVCRDRLDVIVLCTIKPCTLQVRTYFQESIGSAGVIYDVTAESSVNRQGK